MGEKNTVNERGRSWARAPRWVRVSGITVTVIAVLLVGMVVFGGGNHGPGRHTPAGHTPPTGMQHDTVDLRHPMLSSTMSAGGQR